MQSKILSKQTWFIIVLIGCELILGCFFILSARRRSELFHVPIIVNSTTFNQPEKAIPVRLKIPKIKVNALVDQIGLTRNGAMDVPTAPLNVGWFKFGPSPGDNGSAVIDGHYGTWKNGQKTVFNDLGQLKPGDSLSVEDEQGVITTFVVRESRTYNADADASNVFSSSDGKSHLNLITCGGIWNTVSKSYPDRLVVFTDKG